MGDELMPNSLTDMRRQALSAYLDKDLARRTREHAKASARSLSSVVAEAPDLYFERLVVFNAIDEIALQDAAHAARCGPFEDMSPVLRGLTAISTEQALQAATIDGVRAS